MSFGQFIFVPYEVYPSSLRAGKAYKIKGEDKFFSKKGIQSLRPIDVYKRQVPVGNEVLGRLFNVIGETIDEKGPLKTEKRAPIHRSAPSFEEQDTNSEIFETGIKVIDLIAPYLSLIHISPTGTFMCQVVRPM